MRGQIKLHGAFLTGLFLAHAFSLPAQISSPLAPVAPRPAYREDRILVMPKQAAATATLHSQLGTKVLANFPGLGGLQLVSVPGGETVTSLIARLQSGGLVEFAEPDYELELFLAPNDPRFADGTLWAFNNFGQGGGVADADIDALEAWEVQNTASNVVVAVLDTGARYTHEDLAGNIWVNPNGGGPGLNAITGTTIPSDDSGHGTGVAGVIGAVGNNGKGVTGVAWRVQLMIGKCFGSFGVGNISDAITCLDFARTNNARVINASWGFSSASQALSNAVLAVRNAGIILVAAAGNSSANLDVSPVYPACYPFDNIISVGFSTRADTLAAASSYGATNVDLVAPGEQIYSTFGATDNFYFAQSGSSFAAPFVSGACALLWAKYPTETHQEIIARVLNGVDVIPSLAGKCVTGGRLNLRKTLSPPIQLTLLSTAPALPLQLRVHAGPNRSCVIEVTTNLTTWSPIFTNTTSAAGTFDFTDSAGANSPGRLFRAISTL
jgi:subtilisin family serine protease